MHFTLVSRIYRPEPSAASLFLGGVADALIAAGHTVDVITAQPPGRQHSTTSGERVRTFPVLRDHSGYVRGYLQYLSFDLPLVIRLLFTRRPAAVLVEPPPTTGAVVRLVCALRRIPYVYDAADVWSDAAGHATSSGLVVAMLRWVECFAWRGARQVVTISQGVVDRIRELGVNAPTTVTGFGADTTQFHYADELTEPYFVYGGTYTELHGAGILIEAFAQFCQTHPGYRLRFIGNGTGHTAMQAHARMLGVESLIDFQPPVSAETLRPILSAATASLATLDPRGGYEYAFATKVYSSLAAGCPVIFAGPGPTASFLAAAPTSIEAGTAVDYNAAHIAEAMREAANQPAGRVCRRNLAEWAHREHSMRAVCEKVARVLSDAASQR